MIHANLLTEKRNICIQTCHSHAIPCGLSVTKRQSERERMPVVIDYQ